MGFAFEALPGRASRSVPFPGGDFGRLPFGRERVWRAGRQVFGRRPRVLALAAIFVLLFAGVSWGDLTNVTAYVPGPGAVTDQPYAPQPVLPGGIVVTLWPSDSPQLHKDRVREAEVYTMSKSVPGRINNIVNVHNPSIEFHPVDGYNSGSVIILAPGGGHNTLVIGSEGCDPVPYFYNYGINTAILRYRLRKDGYVAEVDAVNDALQAIRVVRSHAKEWKIDPNRIGIMGFSAGAELSAPAALAYEDFDKKNSDANDPLSGVSSRPDFSVLVYPGPSPFARNPDATIPQRVPPSFIVCSGTGDRIHAVWADQYFIAMLQAGVPNIEMHIYARGAHGGGFRDREGSPLGTWQDRFIDWFRDLGFLQKPGVVTRAAEDVEKYSNQPRPSPIRRPRTPETTNGVAK